MIYGKKIHSVDDMERHVYIEKNIYMLEIYANLYISLNSWFPSIISSNVCIIYELFL